MLPKVAVIVLNWNGYEDTLEGLKSLMESSYSNLQIIVVDNCSSDGSVSAISKAYPEIVLLRNEKNLGFAEGNNVGIRYAIKRNADYFFLFNNDATIEKIALARLVDIAESNIQIGILGPQIYFHSNPDTIESSGARFNPITGRTYHLNNGNKLNPKQDCFINKVDFISGCAMLIKKEVLRDIGYLDLEYFCYLEDADLCIRARKAGYEVANVPSAKVWHKGGRSSGGYSSPIRIYYGLRNHLLLVDKNYPLKNPFMKGLRYLNILSFYLLFIFVNSFVQKRHALVYFYRGIEDFIKKRFGVLNGRDF